MAVLPGWTHDLPTGLDEGVTAAVAGVDWNSAGAISRVIDDAECGVAVALYQGRIVAYVQGVTVFDAVVATDTPAATETAVAAIAQAIRSHL